MKRFRGVGLIAACMALAACGSSARTVTVTASSSGRGLPRQSQKSDSVAGARKAMGTYIAALAAGSPTACSMMSPPYLTAMGGSRNCTIEVRVGKWQVKPVPTIVSLSRARAKFSNGVTASLAAGRWEFTGVNGPVSPNTSPSTSGNVPSPQTSSSAPTNNGVTVSATCKLVKGAQAAQPDTAYTFTIGNIPAPLSWDAVVAAYDTRNMRYVGSGWSIAGIGPETQAQVIPGAVNAGEGGAPVSCFVSSVSNTSAEPTVPLYNSPAPPDGSQPHQQLSASFSAVLSPLDTNGYTVR